ncbi:ABC-F family ATP-binding cassette domain-containing protein [Lujinxingia vulgaris]|uniref:ABC-F family ATP-binding cassette domain-containing protein n=1 Tax=Lujinxingia vulgaris TaxID=2600176 RepID=A0A5C6X9H8_9DELT|nr:ABC-F family ATP-binding cassette domain-containing protein [Lujinxingia vulgaris]TXD35844.1 ABC-F family ATP-binding cassette domain-containing protein [Lujinxingia vulgaris]
MFSIHDIGVMYGARTLFKGATVAFDGGSRYGIVGANGAGKSTLLRVISGQEEPTYGDVAIPKDKRVGVLRQNHFEYDDVPILDVVMMGVPELWAAMVEKEAMLAKAAEDPEAFDVERFGDLEDVVMAFDGYAMESKAADILEGLNIPTEKHREPLSSLSGGYKLRVLLAQTLAGNPDILLLDEPTNHLDIVSIAWLERFLSDYAGCVVVVSHDHQFLNTICTHIIDVDYERVLVYKGNYERFEKAKVEDRDRQEAKIAKQQAFIAEQEAFIKRFKAKASKARQAQSRVKQVEKEKMEVEELPQSSRMYPTFNFKAARDTGKEVLRVEGLTRSFEERTVLNDVTFSVNRGDRVAIVGPNGIGKSTLLKLAMGELDPDRGEIEWGHAVEPGYFSQDLADLKGSAETTLHDWLWSHFPDKPNGYIRGKLAEVLFGKEDIEKRVGALSGGEKARLAFARLGVAEPTVLVLDEPTNHLDLEGIDSLARGLEAYPNTILFVSHDRWFVQRLATRVLEITPEGVNDFKGGYAEFLRWREGADHLDRAEVAGAGR